MMKKRRDLILIGVLILVAAVAFLFMQVVREDGARIVVSVDGVETESFSLAVDTTYLIETEGDGENALVIRDGKAYLESANCPDHLCVNQGEISFSGQTIVCLPHKVVISVVSGEDAGVDAVAK